MKVILVSRIGLPVLHRVDSRQINILQCSYPHDFSNENRMNLSKNRVYQGWKPQLSALSGFRSAS